MAELQTDRNDAVITAAAVRALGQKTLLLLCREEEMRRERERETRPHQVKEERRERERGKNGRKARLRDKDERRGNEDRRPS